MKYLFLSLFLCSSITAFSQDTLSIKDIPAAERLMDLQFKPTERDSLFDNVKDNMKE